MARTVNDQAPLNDPQPPDHSHIPCLADQCFYCKLLNFVHGTSRSSAGYRMLIMLLDKLIAGRTSFDARERN